MVYELSFFPIYIGFSTKTEDDSLNPTLFDTDINPFVSSFDFALLECPLKNVCYFLLIKSGLFHQGSGINSLFRSIDNF